MSEHQEEMKIDPVRAQALISQLGAVKERIAAVAGNRTVRHTSLSHPYHPHTSFAVGISDGQGLGMLLMFYVTNVNLTGPFSRSIEA